MCTGEGRESSCIPQSKSGVVDISSRTRHHICFTNTSNSGKTLFTYSYSHRRTGQRHLGGADRVFPEWIQWGGGSSRNFPGSMFRGGGGGSSRNFAGSILCGVAEFFGLLQ